MSAPQWRIGENLPWTAPWSGEGEFRLAPSATFPEVFGELVQREAQGEGEPQFQGMNLMRQRRGVVGHLCQVCGEPTPPTDRWLFPDRHRRLHQGRRRPTLRQPHATRPTQPAPSARRGLCPHLRASLAEPVAFPRDVGFLAPETSLPNSLAHLAGQLPDGVVVLLLPGLRRRLHPGGSPVAADAPSRRTSAYPRNRRRRAARRRPSACRPSSPVRVWRRSPMLRDGSPSTSTRSAVLPTAIEPVWPSAPTRCAVNDGR